MPLKVNSSIVCFMTDSKTSLTWDWNSSIVFIFLILDLKIWKAKKVEPGKDKNLDLFEVRLDFIKLLKSALDKSFFKTSFVSKSEYGSITYKINLWMIKQY